MTEANVTDDMRKEALAKTSEIMAELDKIRKRLELPLEQLPLVAEIYAGSLYAISSKAFEDKERAKRKKWKAKVADMQAKAEAGIPSIERMGRPLGGHLHGHGGHMHGYQVGVPYPGSMGPLGLDLDEDDDE